MGLDLILRFVLLHRCPPGRHLDIDGGFEFDPKQIATIGRDRSFDFLGARLGYEYVVPNLEMLVIDVRAICAAWGLALSVLKTDRKFLTEIVISWVSRKRTVSFLHFCANDSTSIVIVFLITPPA